MSDAGAMAMPRVAGDRSGKARRLTGLLVVLLICAGIASLSSGASDTSLGHALRGTPFERISPLARFQTAPKHLLLPVSRMLELTAMQSRVPPILLTCFQRHDHLTPPIAATYAELGARLPFVAAFGTDMPAVPAPGVRGVRLDPADPLVQEWAVVVLGANECVALVARDLGDVDVPDADRRFEFTITHDPANVAAVAHTLIGRMSGA